jgi:hypothetical protein
MKLRVAVPLAVAILIAAWSPSMAVDRYSVELGVQGSFASLASNLNLDDTFSGSVRGGFVLHPAFEIVAFYDTLSTQSNKPAARNSDYSQDFLGVRVQGVFRAAEESRINPYMFAGGGEVKTTFDPGLPGHVEDEDTASFEDVGGGIRIHIWKGLHANGEFFIRHLRTLDKTSSSPWFGGGVSWFIGGKK